MNRKQRYIMAYAAIGLVRSNAPLNTRRAAYRDAVQNGLTPEEFGRGTQAAMAMLDQVAIQSLCSQLVDEPDQPTPIGE